MATREGSQIVVVAGQSKNVKVEAEISSIKDVANPNILGNKINERVKIVKVEVEVNPNILGIKIKEMVKNVKVEADVSSIKYYMFSIGSLEKNKVAIQAADRVIHRAKALLNCKWDEVIDISSSEDEYEVIVLSSSDDDGDEDELSDTADSLRRFKILRVTVHSKNRVVKI